jgi:glycosyltransferase involved in cell wall biosynthesis
MRVRGLVISMHPLTNDSAYTHRVVNLARCLERRGIPSDYFYMPDNPPLDTQTTAFIFMPFWIRMLRKYDFIYCGGDPTAQTMFFCKPFLKCPVIFDVHGDEPAQDQLFKEVNTPGRRRSVSFRVRLINFLAMNAADHLLAVSRLQIDTFVRSGIPAEQISLIRNGVDLDLFRPLPFQNEPEFTFCYVGEFQHWQNVDNLIAAFERLNNPAVRMLVVGFRERDRPIKQLFADKFGRRVELIDRVDRQALPELVQRVGVLVIPRSKHPAIRHAFPTKFAEYASWGRPIMVNNVDETAEFVKQYDCGFVSDPSPEAMAATMEEASRVPVEVLSQMGSRARKAAEENFSWDKIGDDYAELIRNLISESSRSDDR